METQCEELTEVIVDGVEVNNKNNGLNQPEDENHNIQNSTTRQNNEINIRNSSFKEAWTGEKHKSNHRQPWMTSLTSFAAEVSVVGFRYVANPSASVFRRSVWVLLILVGAAFTVFQIQNRIRHYADYPVNVIIRVEHVGEMRFPTVTICNENRASLSRVAAMGE